MSDIENLSQRSFMPDFKFQYTPSIKEEVQQAIENTKDKPGDEMLSILQEEIKQFQTKLDDKHVDCQH